MFCFRFNSKTFTAVGNYFRSARGFVGKYQYRYIYNSTYVFVCLCVIFMNTRIYVQIHVCSYVCMYFIYISVLLSDYVFNAPDDDDVVAVAIKSVLRCSFVYFWFCRTFWLSAMAAEPLRNTYTHSDTETPLYKYIYIYVHYTVYTCLYVKFIMSTLSGNCCCCCPLPAQFNRIESAPRKNVTLKEVNHQAERLVVSSHLIENNLFYLLTILRFNLIKALRAGSQPAWLAV